MKKEEQETAKPEEENKEELDENNESKDEDKEEDKKEKDKKACMLKLLLFNIVCLMPAFIEKSAY